MGKIRQRKKNSFDLKENQIGKFRNQSKSLHCQLPFCRDSHFVIEFFSYSIEMLVTIHSPTRLLRRRSNGVWKIKYQGARIDEESKWESTENREIKQTETRLQRVLMDSHKNWNNYWMHWSLLEADTLFSIN